jgi:sortase (surface protein transpeptidase)
VAAAAVAALALAAFWLQPWRVQRAASATGSQVAAAAGGDEGETVVRSLEELREQYGDPRDANYGRMRIPALGIDAPIGRRVVAADGQLADPSGPSDVVLYDFSGWRGYGGMPGGGGNAIFAGHVDRNAFLAYAGVRYLGPGIFYQLRQLEEGDSIEVTAAGRTYRYHVIWVRETNAKLENWAAIMSSDVKPEAITLITCGGGFDDERGEYTHRTVVRALRS